MRWTCQLPSKLNSLATELANQADSTARYLHLVKLGDTIQQLSVLDLDPTSRVPGCTSITHVTVEVHEDDRVSLHGFSDARISRGMLAMLILGLDGLPRSTVLSLTAEEVLKTSGLQGTISHARISGLSAIMHEIHRQILHGLERAPQEKLAETEKVRWTDTQGEDVAVLLSGGVDSSVALRLALESGARPHPFYLKIWLDDELAHLGTCPWEEDIASAEAVCKQVGLTLTDVAFQKEYWEEVVAYTVDEARAGRTPNPDVMCNSRVKFGAFYERIGKNFDRVVSGHYARTKVNDGKAELWVSPDEIKDQTYFLAHLRQEQLGRVWFPVGDYSKVDVRKLAEQFELPNQNRPDSQGICFLGKVKFDDFLKHHLGERQGSLVEFESGNELGHHNGFWFFTVGQRRGVGLSGGPWYVVHKNVEKNVVYVSKDYNNVKKERNRFDFERPVWISGQWPIGLSQVGNSMKMRVKTRHGPNYHECVTMRRGMDSGRVELKERDKGLAAGQFAAFYDYEGRCLGSGIISNDSSLHDLPQEIRRMDKKSARLQANV